MQDPGNIRNIPINTNTNSLLELTKITEFEDSVYDLDDEKDFQKYIKEIEKAVRTSIEYRRFISYLRDYMDMNKCAFFENTTRDRDSKVKIEIHHYPFTLYDICKIVYNKRTFYGESVEREMVAKEVMQLHYQLVIGLIPVSETIHELAHNEWIFIPVDKVLGNWQAFRDAYKDFMEADQYDVLERIVEYSGEYEDKGKERNRRILQQTNIYLNYDDPSYKIPDLRSAYENMRNRIDVIKQNYYMLPEVTDEEYNLKKQEIKENKIKNAEKINPFIMIDDEVY